MNIVGYIRVSSEEQVENFSLGNQEDYIRNYCNKTSSMCIKIFKDEGKSAKNTNRQELNNLLEFVLNQNNKVDAVAVYKIDRLSRETGDYLNIKKRLLSNGISIISVTEPIDSSPQGEFLETIMAAQGKLDNAMKSQRTKDGMTKRLEAGLPTNPPPAGYIFENNEAGRNNVVPDEPRYSILQNAGKEYLKGIYNFSDIARYLQEKGFKNKKNQLPTDKFVAGFLTNKFYTGCIVSKTRNKEYKGSYMPMFSLAEWERIQSIKSGISKSYKPHLKNNPDFPLRGFCYCGKCGRKLTGAWSQGRSSKYAYYFCKSHRPSIDKYALENEFSSYLAILKPTNQAIDEFSDILYIKYQESLGTLTNEARSALQTVSFLENKKNSVIEKNIRGVYSDEITKEQLDLIQKEIGIANDKVYELNSHKLNATEIKDFSRDFLTNFRTTWETAELQTKQRLQQVIFPEGISYEYPGIRTATICPILEVIKDAEVKKVSLG